MQILLGVGAILALLKVVFWFHARNKRKRLHIEDAAEVAPPSRPQGFYASESDLAELGRQRVQKILDRELGRGGSSARRGRSSGDGLLEIDEDEVN